MNANVNLSSFWMRNSFKQMKANCSSHGAEGASGQIEIAMDS